MPQLTIVLPTYNERDNICPLIQKISQSLAGFDYEITVVDDDSPDGTAAVARTLAQLDNRVRVIHRIGRRGLASAIIEGMLASSAPYLAVMDADQQHDEAILPEMISLIMRGDLDIVIASRNLAPDGMGQFSRARQALSNSGLRLSTLVCKKQVSDPMSGYFVLSRSFLHEVLPNLSQVGFKLLVDILASSRRKVKLSEVPYVFRNRKSGTSKLDLNVTLEYAVLLLDKATRGWIPGAFMLYCLVGSLGLFVNTTTFLFFHHLRGVEFEYAHLIAGAVAVICNFVFNNAITFRNGRLRGCAFWKGLLMYGVVCSCGVYAQFLAARTPKQDPITPVLLSSVIIVVGSTWNYAVASLLVWRVRSRRSMKMRPVYDNRECV